MLIVDVREPEEYSQGHVGPAKNVPLATLKAQGLPEVPVDEQIIVYCNVGDRAAEAVQTLREMGYKNVTNCINQQGTEAKLKDLEG